MVQPVPEGQSTVEFECVTVTVMIIFLAGEEGEPKNVLESFRVGVPGEGPATCQRVEATDGWQHRLGPVTRCCFCNSTRFLFFTFGNYEVKRTLSENDKRTGFRPSFMAPNFGFRVPEFLFSFLGSLFF